MATTGKNILAYRTLAGMSRKELAEKLSITVSAISNYENEHRLPDLAMLKRISAVLNVAVAELIGDDASESEKGQDTDAGTSSPIRRSPYEVRREQEMIHTYQKLNPDNRDIVVGHAKQLLKEQQGQTPPKK